VAQPDQIPGEPYLRSFVSFQSLDGATTTGGADASAWLVGNDGTGTSYGGSVARPDVMHWWLVQQAPQSGRSVAFVLQSLLTQLTGMTYYENLGNFDMSASVEQSYFELLSVSLSYRGLAAVVTTLLAYMILLAVVLYLFLAHTASLLLGATFGTHASPTTAKSRSEWRTEQSPWSAFGVSPGELGCLQGRNS